MSVRIPDTLDGLLVPIDAVRPDPANYNQHSAAQIEQIAASLVAFGFDQPILARRNGLIIAGHGRLLAARQVGMTHVPVVYTDLDGVHAARRMIGDNRLAALAEPDAGALAELLRQLQAEDALGGTGYDDAAVDALLAEIAAGAEAGKSDHYSRKIEAPTYTPSNVKPAVVDLYDDSRTQALVKDIQTAEGLTDEERAFLVIAAQRHTVLRFNKIADYYAHADAGLQRLMEDSALVIIDFNRAIELGFVRLTEKIAEQVRDEYGE